MKICFDFVSYATVSFRCEFHKRLYIEEHIIFFRNVRILSGGLTCKDLKESPTIAYIWKKNPKQTEGANKTIYSELE